jgi:hypothetical protein
VPFNPNHKIRTAHSVEIFTKQLSDFENSSEPDAMTLIGLWDEIMRVDRKWREQIARGGDRRQPGDEAKVAGWFERLIRQIDRVLRTPKLPAAEKDLLQKAKAACESREPFPKLGE